MAMSKKTYGLLQSNAGNSVSSLVIAASFSLYSPYENNDLAALDYDSFAFFLNSFIFSNSSLSALSVGFNLIASLISLIASSC